MVLATQNPMDLDYRALSNAGTWCLGRLSTHADRERVLEGLGEHTKKSAIAEMFTKNQHRWFVVRDAEGSATSLRYPRHAISYLRGPVTRVEIRRAREATQEIVRVAT